MFDTHASNIVLGGGWGLGISAATRVSDNVLLRGTEAGLYLDADADPATGPLLEHNTIVGAKGTPGAGLHFAGTAGLTATAVDNLVTGSNAGVDGWGQVNVTFRACGFFGNRSNVMRALKGTTAEQCSLVDPQFGDLTKPAGDDGVFFTADDPWLPRAKEVLTGAADGGAIGARL